MNMAGEANGQGSKGSSDSPLRRMILPAVYGGGRWQAGLSSKDSLSCHYQSAKYYSKCGS